MKSPKVAQLVPDLYRKEHSRSCLYSVLGIGEVLGITILFFVLLEILKTKLINRFKNCLKVSSTTVLMQTSLV